MLSFLWCWFLFLFRMVTYVLFSIILLLRQLYTLFQYYYFILQNTKAYSASSQLSRIFLQKALVLLL